MTWEIALVLTTMVVCGTAIVAIFRITREAVNAKDLLDTLNLMDKRISELNAVLSPLFRGRGADPLGIRRES